uniref:Uncharacterized protein n=1 Tax=viral metagenome TaxID=1070528 RepID=A0A6M3IWF9_9ZZZZ
MNTKSGGARIGVNTPFYYRDILVDGAIATDGVQWSTVATVGTTAAEVFSKFIDPGVTVGVKKMYVAFSERFTGLNGSFVASMNYYWQARTEAKVPSGGQGNLANLTGAWVNLTGTYQKAVGTLTTSDDTPNGYAAVASIPYAPIRVRLMAVGIQAAVMTGKIKNSSIVELMGNVIPGV